MENSTRTYPRARDPPNGVQEDERGALTAQPPAPAGEADLDGPLRNSISERTVEVRLRACAPECALTVPAWRVHPLQCMYTYIYSPVHPWHPCIPMQFRARGFCKKRDLLAGAGLGVMLVSDPTLD